MNRRTPAYEYVTQAGMALVAISWICVYLNWPSLRLIQIIFIVSFIMVALPVLYRIRGENNPYLVNLIPILLMFLQCYGIFKITGF